MNRKKINDIFKEIFQERIRQNEKWGEQNHPITRGKYRRMMYEILA